MPQIEIPFTPGQRVRTNEDGDEWNVVSVEIFEGKILVHVAHEGLAVAFYAGELTLVEPVIKWGRIRPDTGWLSEDRAWYADDKGTLTWETHIVGTFPNPRAIAEATQKMWNEARKG